MKSNLKSQLMTWASIHNFNCLVGFHDYVRGLFKEQLEELERCENKGMEYKLQKSNLYDYDRIHHINTLLMMYSYLEEWLYLCWKTYASNTVLVTMGGSLGRFQNVAKHLGVDLSSKLWEELRNTEEIRNCLLHANGRISLHKDPQRIKSIIKKQNTGLKITQDRIQISGEYLECFNKNISELMDSMIKNKE